MDARHLIPQPNHPQLLVSIRNLAEAKLALAAGVDWIDLKEPASGPLGHPTVETAREVGNFLVNFPQRSVALGELEQLDISLAVDLARQFPVAKVGLAGLGPSSSWQRRFRDLQCNLQASLVPVVYGDWEDCDAPSPASVLELAVSVQASYVLYDTFTKNGLSLLEHLNRIDLEQWILEATTHGIQTVLAGSLTERDWPELQKLPWAAIALRGAVCEGHRSGEIAPLKLEQWRQRVRSHSSAASITAGQ